MMEQESKNRVKNMKHELNYNLDAGTVNYMVPVITKIKIFCLFILHVINNGANTMYGYILLDI
jgi:hypothetical protein